MRFQGTLKLEGKTATGFQVPPQIVEALDAGKKPPVRVTIGAHSYRSTIAVMGGVFMLPVSAENRAGAGIAAGDTVEVEVELDTAPRTVELPPDFSAALEHESSARRTFDALSYSQQRAIVLSIQDAKTAETRERRIAKAVDALNDGRPGR
jgi:hypothetical protein